MVNDLIETPFSLAPLKNEWGWLLALGIGLVVLGTLSIAMPFVATIQFVEVLGILLAIAGISQVVGVFHSKLWRGFIIQAAVGILYLVTSFLMMVNPVEGAAGLTLLMAAFFLSGGLFRVLFSLSERFPGWGWTLLNGVITILMGLIIWRQFPESALWVIGMLVGIELLFCGWAWIMLAVTARSAIEKHESHAQMSH